MPTSTDALDRPVTATAPRRLALPRWKTLAKLLLAAGLVVLAFWLVLAALDRRGRQFYETGRGAVETLEVFARYLALRNVPSGKNLMASDFSGTSLGLTRFERVEEKDGVVRLRFVATPGTLDRSAAAAEWQAYLDGWSSLDEVGLHLDRVESWKPDGEVTATVRFEVIGTPRGHLRPAIDRARFRMRFAFHVDDIAIREASLVEGERLFAEQAHFAEVGERAGIDFPNRFYPPFLDRPLRFGMIRYGPAGIAAADYDNDGFYDLFVPDGVESRLFRNRRDGGFEDVTAASGLGGLSGVSVGVFADYDNDGWRDLFVSRTFEPNQLFHANGDGTFTDVTARSGMGADCCTTVASWADYDLDGDLDLYVGRYLDPRTKIPTTFYARNGEPNQLYRNDGDGTFTNVTVEAGVGETGLCLGSAFGDYDDDGDPDLYVVNDFGRKTLYRNEGNGTFTDVTVASGTLAYGAGMSASFGDYDNDGRLDLYVAHIRSEHAWFGGAPTVGRYMANSFRQGLWATDMPLYFEIFRQSGTRFVEVFQAMASGNNLLRNKGDGTFEDVTWQAGVNPIGWFWGSSFADFDNDGFQDLYSANGWVYGEKGTEMELEFLNQVVGDQRKYKSGALFDPAHFGDRSWHGWERNRHLRNRGDGTFEEIGLAAGTDLLTNSRGLAVADFWNRGVLDMAVAASTDRHRLLANAVGTQRSWLEVELVGTRSNRDAVGARVTLRAGGKTLTREVVAGDGYASQNMLRLHFGLGDAERVEELTVRWPVSGTVQRFSDLGANRLLEITEGGALVEKRYGAAE